MLGVAVHPERGDRHIEPERFNLNGVKSQKNTGKNLTVTQVFLRKKYYFNFNFIGKILLNFD